MHANGPETYDPILDNDITAEKVDTALSQLKSQKAAVVDWIIPELLRMIR